MGVQKKLIPFYSGIDIFSPSEASYADRAYEIYSQRILNEGESPQNAELVSLGLEQLVAGDVDLELGLKFEQPICSTSLCLVKADVSQATFSADKVDDDPDYVANDSYYRFIEKLQKSIDKAMSEKTQVSIARSGDQLVLNISPKKTGSRYSTQN